MRLVAGEIADDARDPGDGNPIGDGQLPWSKLPVEGYHDRSGRWHEGLVERCGASMRAISDSLTELGKAGYEMRKPIIGADGKPVTDKRGRLVFAVKGHSLEFHVPPLPPRPEPQSSHPGAAFAGESSQQGASFAGDSTHGSATNESAAPVDNPQGGEQSMHEGATFACQRSHPAVSKVAPQCDPFSSVSPQEDLSPQQHVDLSAQPEVEVPNSGPGQDPESRHRRGEPAPRSGSPRRPPSPSASRPAAGVRRCQHGYPVAIDNSTTCPECDLAPGVSAP